MYDQTKLISLIKNAQGNLGLNKFANLCGISAGNLSKILNRINPNPPRPETLEKIAKHSQDKDTYNNLMIAAGHIKTIPAPIEVSSSLVAKEIATNVNMSELTKEDEMDIEKDIEKIRQELLNNPEKVVLGGDTLCPEAIESLIEVLSHGIHYAKLLNNFNNKME